MRGTGADSHPQLPASQNHPSEDMCRAQNHTRLAILFGFGCESIITVITVQFYGTYLHGLPHLNKHQLRSVLRDAFRLATGLLLEPQTFCCYCLYINTR